MDIPHAGPSVAHETLDVQPEIRAVSDAVASVSASLNTHASREAAGIASRLATAPVAGVLPSNRELFRTLLAARTVATPSPALPALTSDRSAHTADSRSAAERGSERERPPAPPDEDERADDPSTTAGSMASAAAAPSVPRRDAPHTNDAAEEAERPATAAAAAKPRDADSPGKPAEAPPRREATAAAPAAVPASPADSAQVAPTTTTPMITPAQDTIASPPQGALRQASELAASLPAGTQLQARVTVSGDSAPAPTGTQAAAIGPLSVGSASATGNGSGAGGPPNGQDGGQPPPTPNPGNIGGADNGAAAQAPGVARFVPSAAATPPEAAVGGSDGAASGDTLEMPAGASNTGLPGTTTVGGSASRVAAPLSAAAAKPAALPQSVPHQVSVHIATAAQEGHDHIDIQLHPESLGRVEVRLDVGSDNRVAALVLADNHQALDALRADARGLERALQDAGLKTDSGSLSFGLRNPDSGGGRGGFPQPQMPSLARAMAGDDVDSGRPIAGHAVAGRTWAGDRRLDIHA